MSIVDPNNGGTAMAPGAIRQSAPRKTVAVTFADGRVFEAPIGARLDDVVAVANPCPALPVVAAQVNGRLRELATEMLQDAAVVPITVADNDGARVYRRSLSFLMLTAAGEIFPDAEVFVEHSAPTVAGYFCEIKGRAPFSQDDLQRIERRMREIVAQDARLVKSEVPVGEAIDLFRSRGEHDKARPAASRASSISQAPPVAAKHFAMPSNGTRLQ